MCTPERPHCMQPLHHLRQQIQNWAVALCTYPSTVTLMGKTHCGWVETSLGSGGGVGVDG